MEFDIQRINQNYLIRLVIYAIFNYKDLRRSRDDYLNSIRGFLKKRVGSDLGIMIDIGPTMDKIEHRTRVIDGLNSGDKKNLVFHYLISATFRSPIKELTIQVNLREWDKYESFLNG